MSTHSVRTNLGLALSCFAILLSACNLPGTVSTPGPATQEALFTAAAMTIQARMAQPGTTETFSAATQGALFTAAAKTVQAGLTLTAPAPTASEMPTETLPPTATPLPSQATGTPSPTPVPTTSTQVTLSASVNTNCRVGPSIQYDVVGYLTTIQTAEVRGRDSSGEWWYIENPSQAGSFCWVWSGTTKVEGETSSLPIITPVPLPTNTATPEQAFLLSYAATHLCGSDPTAIFKIENTGTSKLESLTLTIHDVSADVDLFGPENSDAPFMGTARECPPGGDALATGSTGYVGGAIGSVASGHTLRATVKLCTQNGLVGECSQKAVEFTAP